MQRWVTFFRIATSDVFKTREQHVPSESSPWKAHDLEKHLSDMHNQMKRHPCWGERVQNSLRCQGCTTLHPPLVISIPR